MTGNEPCLAQKIDETRITYPERKHGVSIEGSPFIVEFGSPVNPERFCDEITTAEEPWQMFGVKSQLSGGDDGEYWKVVGSLIHVDEEEMTGVSSISLEVCPEWVRIYVKEDCSAERAAEFVRTVQDEYDGDVVFSGE